MTSKLSPIRAVGIALGAWLFLSAFAWPHTAAQRTNTWALGLLSVAVSILTVGAPQARYVNTALAIWLFISAFALPTLGGATTWNACVVAVSLFFVSLASGEERITARSGR